MKIILILFLFFSSINLIAQKISDMPTHNGTLNNAYIPIINPTNKKYTADSLVTRQIMRDSLSKLYKYTDTIGLNNRFNSKANKFMVERGLSLINDTLRLGGVFSNDIKINSNNDRKINIESVNLLNDTGKVVVSGGNSSLITQKQNGQSTEISTSRSIISLKIDQDTLFKWQRGSKLNLPTYAGNIDSILVVGSDGFVKKAQLNSNGGLVQDTFVTLGSLLLSSKELNLTRNYGTPLSVSLAGMARNTDIQDSLTLIKALIKQDTLYVLAMGQSNIVGGSQGYSSNLDTLSNNDVQAWDSTAKQWKRYLAGAPWIGNNTNSPQLQFYFARKLAKENNAIVRVVVQAQGATPIELWHDGVNRGQYLLDAITQSQQAGVPRYDYFIWGQGEALSMNMSIAQYNVAYDSLKAVLRSYSFFSKTTPIAVLGMPDVMALCDTSICGSMDYNKRLTDINSDIWDGYVNTRGITVNPGNEIHYNSAGLKELGSERVWATFKSLPSKQYDAFPESRYINVSGNYFKAGQYIGSKDTTPISFGWRDGKIGLLSGERTIFGFSSLLNNNGAGVAIYGDAIAPNATFANYSLLAGSYSVNKARKLSGVTALGYNSFYFADSVYNSLAIGVNSGYEMRDGYNNTFIGSVRNVLHGDNNTLIGNYYSGNTTLNGSIAIADGLGRTRFFSDNNLNTGIGTETPTAKLDINGALRIRLGTPSAGQVWTATDNIGNGSWQTISGTGYTLPIASASVLGGIKVGAGLAIAGDGTLSVTGGGGGSYINNVGLFASAQPGNFYITGRATSDEVKTNTIFSHSNSLSFVTSAGSGLLGVSKDVLNNNYFNIGALGEYARIGTSGGGSLSTLEIAAANVLAQKIEGSSFKIKQSANDPTTTDITDGYEQTWHNTTTGVTKRWVNVGGTLKSITFN